MQKRLPVYACFVVLYLVFIHHFIISHNLQSLEIFNAGNAIIINLQNRAVTELSFLAFLYPPEGTWCRSILNYIVIVLVFHFYMAFWTMLLFNFTFASFLCTNINNFKNYLQNLANSNTGPVNVQVSVNRRC